MTVGEFIRSWPLLETYRRWTATPRLREACFRVAAIGFALSVLIYAASFLGFRVQGWLAFSHIPCALLIFSVADVSLLRGREGFWGYERWPLVSGVPLWIKVVSAVFFAVVAAHFLLVVSANGSAEIADGVYVLAQKGTVIREITRAEYLSLRQREMRFALSFGEMIWFNALACWWVQRRSLTAK